MRWVAEARRAPARAQHSLSADRKQMVILIVIICALSGPCLPFPSSEMRKLSCSVECLHQVDLKLPIIQTTQLCTAKNMEHLPNPLHKGFNFGLFLNVSASHCSRSALLDPRTSLFPLPLPRLLSCCLSPCFTAPSPVRRLSGLRVSPVGRVLLRI